MGEYSTVLEQWRRKLAHHKFKDGSGVVLVILYQMNAMSLMVDSELKGHLDRMELVDKTFKSHQ